MFYLYDVGLVTLITRSRSTFLLLIMTYDMVSKFMKWRQTWQKLAAFMVHVT